MMLYCPNCSFDKHDVGLIAIGLHNTFACVRCRCIFQVKIEVIQLNEKYIDSRQLCLTTGSGDIITES